MSEVEGGVWEATAGSTGGVWGCGHAHWPLPRGGIATKKARRLAASRVKPQIERSGRRGRSMGQPGAGAGSHRAVRRRGEHDCAEPRATGGDGIGAIRRCRRTREKPNHRERRYGAGAGAGITGLLTREKHKISPKNHHERRVCARVCCTISL